MGNLVKKPSLSFIVAASLNGVIGKDGVMPWHLPGDLHYFKQTTMGKPVIMGSKTWASLKRKPLPGRANIVLTSASVLASDRQVFRGAFSASSLEQAMQIAFTRARADQSAEVFVIGGASVYQQALPQADKIYWTEIQAEIEGDAFFKPDLPEAEWERQILSSFQKNAGDSHAYRFLLYTRRR